MSLPPGSRQCGRLQAQPRLLCPAAPPPSMIVKSADSMSMTLPSTRTGVCRAPQYKKKERSRAGGSREGRTPAHHSPTLSASGCGTIIFAAPRESRYQVRARAAANASFPTPTSACNLLLTFSKRTQGTGRPSSLASFNSLKTCLTSPVLCGGDVSNYAAARQHKLRHSMADTYIAL